MMLFPMILNNHHTNLKSTPFLDIEYLGNTHIHLMCFAVTKVSGYITQKMNKKKFKNICKKWNTIVDKFTITAECFKAGV